MKTDTLIVIIKRDFLTCLSPRQNIVTESGETVWIG